MSMNSKVVETTDLRDLAPLAAELNRQTDALNASLKSIQEGMNRMKVGLEEWVPVNETDWETVEQDGEEVPACYRDEIGYGRHGDGWELLVRRRRIIEPGTDKERAFYGADRIPLLSAPRELRIAAVTRIPDLLTALKKRTEQAINSIEAARKLAENMAIEQLVAELEGR